MSNKEEDRLYNNCTADKNLVFHMTKYLQNNYILKPNPNYLSTYLTLGNQENLDYIPALASEVPMLFS